MHARENIVIVGAGPAGLAVAAHLRKRDLDFMIIEQADMVAPAWHNHYERLHLHTVKQHSSLPFVPFPDDYPTYVSRDQLASYLVDYAKQFDINPIFNCRVDLIQKAASGWNVTTDETSVETNSVVIATGINRIPVTPSWPGIEEFAGPIVHSLAYRNADPFSGQKILVVGMGNTGAEVALDLAENHVDVSISVRGPVNIVPRDAFGQPTQKTALRLQFLPTALQDRIARLTQSLTIGDLSRYGIHRPNIAPTAQLREQGKTPVIDLGTVRMIRDGRIKVLPDISEFSEGRPVFSDGSSQAYEAIVLCTGFRSSVENFFPAATSNLDDFGNPKKIVGSGTLDGSYFIGFDNFRPGGILGIINTDSKRIADHIAGKGSFRADSSGS